MSKTAMIRARVTPQLKSSAEGILKKLGVSSTEAITMFYMQIVLHKAIPFEIRLEAKDKKKQYTRVRNSEHLKQLIDG
jgi:DNA-damage-inducible protein J